MASRLRLTIDPAPIAERLAETPARLRQWSVHLQRLGWRAVLWRALWLPFWFGGDIPAPWWPDRRHNAALPDAPAARGVITALDDIGRRAWRNIAIAALIRGLWLPFLFGSIAVIVQVIRSEPFVPQRVAWLWAVTVPLALLFTWFIRPTRARTAAMLDRTFGLHDRLTTALESQTLPHGSRSERAHLPYLQLADAANVANELRSDPRFRLRLPARELSMAILAGLLMLALLFVRGVGGDLPGLTEASVPRFVPAAERRTAAAGELNTNIDVRPPTVAEVEAASERSSSATADLNAVADALEANALTQPAADAIRAGNYAAAGQALRDSAAAAGGLPAESREALATALDEAAAATADSSPALSNAASEAAAGLRAGGQAATSSMQDLGDAVELAGETVVPNDVLAAQMQQAQQAAAAGGSQGADAAQQPGQAGNPGGTSNPQAGQGGEPGEPTSGGSGAGADASGGSGSTDGDPGSGGGSSDGLVDAPSGAGDQAGGEFGDEQTGGSEGEEGGAGQEGAQAGNQPGDESGQFGPDGQPLDTEIGAQSGNGASSGSAEPSDSDDSAAAGSGQHTGASATGEPPAEPDLSNAAVNTGPGDASDITANQSIGLNDPGGGDAFQLGGGGSAASLGSGAGVMVAGGNATQEAVSAAGPESNRTPAKYRSIVENYFARD